MSFNLEKLFAAQKELQKVGRFNYQGEDRFVKLVLALLVEVGECANCWRGFKFWSKRQEPLIEIKLNSPSGGTKTVYPLLEEYVDGLHFVLELGIELQIADSYMWFAKHNIKTHTYDNTTSQFVWIYNTATKLFTSGYHETWEILFYEYVALGEMLGFTWEQIEQAYFEKNAVNHQRQENGY